MQRSFLWLGGLTLGLAGALAPVDWVRDAQGRSPFSDKFLAQFSAQAQGIAIVGDRWKRVYDRMPEIPLENTYVRRDTNEVDPTDTLVTRLIRYHMYSKGRSPLFRLDWKLTLADYMGINELIPPDTYPSNTRLKENPRYGDMAAISELNRDQRNRLIETLIAVFEPKPDPNQVPDTPQDDNNNRQAPPPTSNSASDLL
ncbi:MAG: hypothetical protein AAF889_14140 [Cyanobacteria bacterium P01_D01_bin.73]